jgi:tetratricopeptide (TPR) repeat protein
MPSQGESSLLPDWQPKFKAKGKKRFLRNILSCFEIGVVETGGDRLAQSLLYRRLRESFAKGGSQPRSNEESKMKANQTNRIARRLTAAEGYLELGLPADALDELLKIENAGPFQAACMWMMGESLRVQGLYEEAIAPLRQAARALPSETGHQAWEALKDCLEKSGRSATAEDMAQTMEYLEQRSDSLSRSSGRIQPASNIRIDIPQFGNLQINFDLKAGLTIKVNPPGTEES